MAAENNIAIELQPLGKVVQAAAGAALQDVLFAEGVEFSCGGRGRCTRCRLKVIEGDLPITEADSRLLTQSQLAEGWRLACRARATGNLKIELAQWEAPILSDDSPLSFTPASGLGIAIDVGTTTVVAQLLDLQSGQVLGVRSALNEQAKHGADIMSRIDFTLNGGSATLTRLIREQLGGLVDSLLTTMPGRAAELQHVVLVGNTVMHHLFCGLSVEPLAHHPFESAPDGLMTFEGRQIGWKCPAARIDFLPCLGSFVGSDILAGVLATKLHESDSLCALVDLGTNGEMVVGNRHRMLFASTAAGPAFEGARISMGMRAATGAISEVALLDDEYRCRVIGNDEPRGICGSGLVDAITAGLQRGDIGPSGRLTRDSLLRVAPRVSITQRDVREVQLAKGAIAAGLQTLVRKWGAGIDDIARLHLAGAFGNYINRASARQIGLLPFAGERVSPAGNTALLGAKLALFRNGHAERCFADLRQRLEHVPLNDDAAFAELFVAEMPFPSQEQSRRQALGVEVAP